MKTRSVKLLALLIAIILIISSLPVFITAADDLQYNYSQDYNSGKRGEVCTTLNGTSASSYYTGSYTYANFITLSKGDLKNSLSALMTNTHTYRSSYNDCHYKADRTDCENGNGKVTLIYTSYQATMEQWNGWNREHVWPKSLGGKNDSDGGGGADLHHIRPSDAGVNSSRGNKKYGNAGSGATKKYGTDPAVDILGGTYNSTYYEPLDNVKGDVARIVLYVHIRWGSAWGADSVTQVFESVDVLLEWCELDPVDTWEMGRNEVIQSIQGNRNVFIDYPELAWQLYGKAVPSDMTTPSGAAKSGNVATPPEGGDTETDTDTDAPVVTPTDPEANTQLSIKDAIALGASKSHNTYTSGKYYVTGVVTEVYNIEYGNMKIKDSEGNILTVYGTYSANGSTRYDSMAVKPVAGDTVTIYGIIGQYNNNPQIKNGWLTAHTPVNSESSSESESKPVESEPVETESPSESETESPSTESIYNKITSLDQLTTGKYVMVVKSGYSPMALDGTWVSTGKPSVSGDSITVENATGYIWNITVNGNSVTLTDSNGVSIAPKGGNNNGIKSGKYSWAVSCSNGTFQFKGTGSDTVTLAANTQSNSQFRAYKNSTVAGNTSGYPNTFTLYKLEKITVEPEDTTNTESPSETESVEIESSETESSEIESSEIESSEIESSEIESSEIESSEIESSETESSETESSETESSETESSEIESSEIESSETESSETESSETESSETESSETESSETESSETESSETESSETESSETESSETESSEIESAEVPSESESADTDPNEDQTTDAPKSSGCGSSISCGAVIISVLCMGLFAVVYKKKEN